MTRTNLVAPLGVNVTPLDYLVSGTLASAVVSGGINYGKVKKGEMEKEEAIKETVKTSAQAGLVAGSTIASIQYFTNKNYLASAISLAVGVGSVVALEKYCEVK